MAILELDKEGIPLRDIISQYGNHNYDRIDFRIKYYDKDNYLEDIWWGAAQYQGGNLIPLDGDNYSLDYTYQEHEEWISADAKWHLTVWEYGRYC